MLQKLDMKLMCPKCGTIYLQFPAPLTSPSKISCTTCQTYLGTWHELKASFVVQSGDDGIFEMDKGQIVRLE